MQFRQKSILLHLNSASLGNLLTSIFSPIHCPTSFHTMNMNNIIIRKKEIMLQLIRFIETAISTVFHDLKRRESMADQVNINHKSVETNHIPNVYY